MSNYKPQEFAEMIGVSVKTLQHWDKEGRLKAYRTPTDRRYYTHKQYVDYMGDGNRKHGKTVIYTRVSTSNQKQELVNDLISIIHVFSCRIYGLRKYKKQIEGDEEIAKELQDRNKSNV